MFKKSFIAMMALMLTFFMAGCGGGGDNKGGNSGGGETKKVEVEKPAYSADKAVMAYAELYSFGVTEHMKEAGMTDKDIEPISNQIIGELVKSFAEYPLSDENIAEMVGIYSSKIASAMGITTTLEKDDPESPVVKLTAKTIDFNGATEMAKNNEDLLALGMAMGALQAEGISLEDLKANAEFQKAAIEAISNFINEFPVNAEKSLEVTCKQVKGSDEKMYWAPSDPEAIAKFVRGM